MGETPGEKNSKWDPPFLDVMGCNREQWVMTGAMSDLVPNISYTIDPFICPYMRPWCFTIIYMKTRTKLKCALNTTPALVFDTDFSSVFPFCAWLLPKSQWFNQQQAKLASVGRLWSYAGIVVWFRAMWTQVQKRTCYFDVHSFYMRHTCTSYLHFLRGEWAYAGACYVSWCICFTSCVKLQWRERNRESILLWQHDWFGTAPLSFFSISALRPFYLVVIKSYHSPALLCLIHLLLSFNLCHTALVYCWLNWFDLAINQIDWPK